MRYTSAYSTKEEMMVMKSAGSATLRRRSDRVVEMREASPLFTPLKVEYRILKEMHGNLVEINACIQGIGYSGLLIKTTRPLEIQDQVVFQFKLGQGLMDEAIHGVVAFSYRDEIGIRFENLTNRQCAAIEAIISLMNQHR